MKKITRLMTVAILALGWTAASQAQTTMTLDQLTRASKQRQQQQKAQAQKHTSSYSQRSYGSSSESEPFSTFYLEYNPSTLHTSYKGYTHNTSYQGFSVGYSYFTPFYEGLGVDFGVKGQFFFRSETEGGVKYKTNMISGTIPVDLAYDWRISDGFAIYPYAGLYARFNITATAKEDFDGGYVTKTNPFNKDEMGGHPWERFQFGWQAGLNFRFSDTFTVGGGYFMDLNEINDHTKIYGFNITLGMNF